MGKVWSDADELSVPAVTPCPECHCPLTPDNAGHWVGCTRNDDNN